MPSDKVFIVPSHLAIFGDFRRFCFARNFCALRYSDYLAIFGGFCFARNYLCPPILWSLLSIPYACMSAAMSLVVGVWVVFCVVVSPVLGASIPVVSKLVLRGPAAGPPKTHIHHLAPTWNNSVVTNPYSCGVVGLDGALRLGPSHISKGLAVWNHFACSDEEGSKF